jgi:hypothetical protein
VLNPEFDFFNELRELLLKPAPGENDRLAKRINGLGKVKLAVVAGMLVSRLDEATYESPADLFLVCDDIDKKKLSAFLKQLESEVGGEIRFGLMEQEESTNVLDLRPIACANGFICAPGYIADTCNARTCKQRYRTGECMRAADGITPLNECYLGYQDCEDLHVCIDDLLHTISSFSSTSFTESSVATFVPQYCCSRFSDQCINVYLPGAMEACGTPTTFFPTDACGDGCDEAPQGAGCCTGGNTCVLATSDLCPPGPIQYCSNVGGNPCQTVSSFSTIFDCEHVYPTPNCADAALPESTVCMEHWQFVSSSCADESCRCEDVNGMPFVSCDQEVTCRLSAADADGGDDE